MSNVKFDDATGEVVSISKFRSMWCNPYGIEAQDLSRETEDVYTEIAPYSIDPKTGKFLNDSSIPKLVKTEVINVHEKIQSFAKEVDLYSILEKFAYSGDASLLNARECQYGDISELPDNLNDYALLVNAHLDNLVKLNPELAKMVIDDKYSPEDIQAKANEIYKQRLEASQAASKTTKEGE